MIRWLLSLFRRDHVPRLLPTTVGRYECRHGNEGHCTECEWSFSV